MTKMSPALRKAAILISALDTPAADRLLEQMGAQQAALVRSAVVELTHIDPQEEDDILGEFFGRQPTVEPDGGVELSLTSASYEVATPTSGAATQRCCRRLAFSSCTMLLARNSRSG